MLNLLQAFPGAPNNIYDESYAIAFSIGTLKVGWYGLFIFFGFIIAIVAVCIKLWKYYKLPIDPFYWFILIGIPISIFGARFWSCCIGNSEWPHFFKIWEGGLAIEGAVSFTIIAGLIWFPWQMSRPKYHIRDLSSGEPQVRRISILLYFDAILPAVLIGQAIGRWGNYFNQEVYGTIVTNENLAWFLHNNLPWMYKDGSYYQPLFFYEFFINLTGFLIIFIAAEFLPYKKAGDLGFGYLIWYGITRLALEPLRDQQFTYIASYVLSALWVAVGLLGIVLNHILSTKVRRLKIWFIIKNETKAFFYQSWNAICIQLLKTQNWFLKFKKINHRSRIEKNIQKIAKIQSAIEINISKRHDNRKQYHRNDAQMAYYFNR